MSPPFSFPNASLSPPEKGGEGRKTLCNKRKGTKEKEGKR